MSNTGRGSTESLQVRGLQATQESHSLLAHQRTQRPLETHRHLDPAGLLAPFPQAWNSRSSHYISTSPVQAPEIPSGTSNSSTCMYLKNHIPPTSCSRPFDDDHWLHLLYLRGYSTYPIFIDSGYIQTLTLLLALGKKKKKVDSIASLPTSGKRRQVV